MQFLHKPYKLLITGRSGSGKTSHALNFITGCDYPKIAIFDPEGEFSLRMNVAACATVEEIEERTKKGEKLILFDSAGYFPGEDERGFLFFCEYFFEYFGHFKGKKLVVIDELQNYMSNVICPIEFSKLLQIGRRRGIDLLVISQQPNLIHNRVRNAVSEVVTFVHNDENAIKFHVPLGFDPEEIRALPELHFIARDLKRGVMSRGVVSHAARENRHLGESPNQGEAVHSSEGESVTNSMDSVDDE